MSPPSSLSNFLVEESDSIRTALQKIDSNAQGICIVVDENGVLSGVATDGDIRRGLLSGAELEDPVITVAERDCVSAPVSATDKEVQGLLSPSVQLIPLLNDEGHPVDYLSPSKNRRFPIMEPYLGGNELAYVTECVETNWISSQGKFVDQFENAISTYVGAPYAVAVSNGTVALHLALEAFEIGQGDEVIVPDLTFAASVNSILHAGATPVLVDICEDTWSIDPTAIEDAITEDTKAIMPVHLYGQPCDMDRISAIAKKYDLRVIEDAAEAIGSTHRGEPVGAIGDAGCFSFFGNKTVTTGEGGIVLFKDEQVYQRAVQLRDHGMSPSKRYWHEYVGYNYRMTNLQAAVGVAQMERIDEIIERKIEIGELYKKNLNTVDGITLPVEIDDRTNTHWLFTALIDKEFGINRHELIGKMKQNGIDLRPVFYPLHEMPVYKEYGRGSYDQATKIAYHGISFPSSLTLSDKDIEEISNVFKSVVRVRKTASGVLQD